MPGEQRPAYARRIERLPLYLFAELEKKIEERRRAGIDIISLGIGDPDLPPPKFIVEAVRKYIDDPSCHGYPTSRGERRIREAIVQWMDGRFGADVDAEPQAWRT